MSDEKEATRADSLRARFSLTYTGHSRAPVFFRSRAILLGEMKYRLNEHVRLFVRRSSG